MALSLGRSAALLLGSLSLVVTSVVLMAPVEAASKLGPSYRVKGVSDGDTIKAVVNGKTERVRLIGIDTPELGRNGGADQCHAREASRQMQKLVQSKRVHLLRDKTQANRDAYGRLLRYVYTAKGERDVGKTLIAKGHGREYTFKNAYRHRSAHLKAERQARNARSGLWRSCGAGAPPTPNGCVIKGNIADDGERIYHLPGQRHYDITIISPAKGERMFCSEADAVAAGWRRSQN